MFKRIRELWQDLKSLWWYSSEGQFGALEMSDEEWAEQQKKWRERKS